MTSATGLPCGSLLAAPIAAPRPKPIVPRPPLEISWRACTNGKCCAVHIWCWPTSVATVISGATAAMAFRILRGSKSSSLR